MVCFENMLKVVSEQGAYENIGSYLSILLQFQILPDELYCQNVFLS